jgi:Reverse transcriptase (RNA-dependent DNA polymerase)
MCAEVPGSPRGTQLQGEPHGEFTSYITLDNGNTADFVFHATLDHEIIAAVQEAKGNPKTLHEAQSCSDWPRWKEVMDHEMGTLEKAGTWNTVPCLPGKNIVGSKWVFCIKQNADGSIDKYKACLVAKGFTQIHGVDYFDTFSPMAKLSSFCTILAYATHYDWEIESFDFNSAYLNAKLDEDEEIYMQEPLGYETGSSSSSVKRLLKLLYSLKQVGQKWYDTLCCILVDLRFRISSADPGVFYAHIDEHILILAIHIDDCAMTGSLAKLISLYKQKLNEQYMLTDLGPIHWLLSIKISRNHAECTISLLQTTYIESIIKRFNLTDAKSVNTPMIPGAAYSKQDSPSDPAEAMQMKSIPYMEAIGSLMYASIATCPNITFAISTLSQFLDNPGPAHWDAVKHIFRYLAGTKTLTLTYSSK